jgi:hypothetical protein
MKALIYTINIINVDTCRLKKIIINILPLDKDVMVDYHTKKQLSPETKSRAVPEMDGRPVAKCD